MLEALRSEHPIELKYARISEPEEPMASAYAQPRKVHRSRHFPGQSTRLAVIVV
ncbi:hypothetical protein SOVF_061010 [Spinacia oleracea]|nr:hypothetical protein SOVF_061010 [Spinacia oleracea]